MMSRKTPSFMIIVLVLLLGLLAGCGGKQETGTLQFYANGEDFVRQGFVSKDGWHINFEHVYIHLQDITGYQSDPPYDAHQAGEINAQQEVSLPGVHTVDLAEGGPDAAPILVGEVKDAPVGHYNTLSWKMTQAPDGPSQGYTLGITGTAEKDGQLVPFQIGIENEYPFSCGEYVGDERKGILQKDGTADLEMTFHFDHIFGDIETSMDDSLNTTAPGFEPFAAAAENGSLTANMATLQSKLSPQDYQKLVDILPTLGHVGEGHCHYGGE